MADDNWIEAMRAKGHSPCMEDGRVDIFVMDSGFHNGPGCITCGESWCMHCTAPENIEPCIGVEAATARDAKYEREREDRILAEADEIRARRANTPST